MDKTAWQRGRRGFTLIELLVAIAIIALLAGIILPVVARSKGKAHQATCTSNLRQLAAAWESYRMDHGGPPPTLIVLERQYVSAPELLYCTADPDEWGYWGTVQRHGDESDDLDPNIRTPFPLTYVYDARWGWDGKAGLLDQALEENPEWGLIGCPCHGTQLASSPLLHGTSFGGLVLRARPDGSVASARISPSNPTQKGVGLVLYGQRDPF
jgi:prepilin-type N-terminal cleavage/methylation domain-containing protein